jgi:hypothetical protein
MEDVCIAICDGLKGLPEAIATVREQATLQTCALHLTRSTFRYALFTESDLISQLLAIGARFGHGAARRRRYAQTPPPRDPIPWTRRAGPHTMGHEGEAGNELPSTRQTPSPEPYVVVPGGALAGEVDRDESVQGES